MTIEYKSKLAHLIAEHHGRIGSTEFADITKGYYLPKYRKLENELRENEAWLEERGDIVKVFRDELGCSEKEAREYIEFYDEVTQIE